MANLAKFRAFALQDLMCLERIIVEVYSEHCSKFTDFSVFDGGAHKGFHTKHFLDLNGCRKVYAIEADPHMAEVLRAQMAADSQSASPPELVIIQNALQDDPQLSQIKWKSSFSHVGRSSISSSNPDKETIWPEKDGVEYRDDTYVTATTIDRILQDEQGPLPFIKLDLEGADLLALLGASQTLHKHRPAIAFENSSHSPSVHGFTLKDIQAYFSEHNYVPITFVGEKMTDSNWFGMFEAFAAPREHADWLEQFLPQAVARQMSKAR